MPFVHSDKKAGDLIRSADWNAMGTEVVRLGIDKISRAGTESLEGPLTVAGKLTTGPGPDGVGLAVRGDLAVGTTNAGSAVRVLKRQEDGRELSHGALVLGTESTSSAALRVGYSSTYSWLQGQGQQAIAINPHGGNVGIGTAAPAATLHVGGSALVSGALRFGETTRQMLNLWREGYGIGVQNSTTYLRSDNHFAFYKGGSHNDAELNAGGGTVLMSVLGTGRVGVATSAPGSTLSVNGNASVGGGYVSTAAPANGLIVQGNVGIGTAAPAGLLHVGGDAVLGGGAGQRFIFHSRTAAAGDFLQVTVDNAAGAWDWAKGITLVRGTGNVGIGTTGPAARLHVAGGDLRLDADRGMSIGDNARISAGTGGALTCTAPVVSLGCYDFNIGHAGRRGSPGRALVDDTRTLVVNYGGDWPDGVQVHKRLRTPSGRAVVAAHNRQDTRTSSTWSDLPDMSLSVTTTGNQVLVLFKTGGVQGTGVNNVQGQFRLLVNGGQVAYNLQEFHNGGWELRDVTLMWLGDLAAGTHTIKVQWITGTANAILTCGWYADARTLMAIEL